MNLETATDPLASQWKNEAMCCIEVPVALAEDLLAYAHKASNLQAENYYLRAQITSAHQRYLQMMEQYVNELDSVKDEVVALREKLDFKNASQNS